MTKKSLHDTSHFFHFLTQSTSSYHTVSASISLLKEAGFTELDARKPWKLEAGQSYYTIPYDTTFFAFTIGSQAKNDSFFVAAAHTDQPCIKIKPGPGLSNGIYSKLNTGVYGGPILNTWMDRPLSIAGKVSLKSSNPIKPQTKYVDFMRPAATIPNLAIHMNREVNKGMELNKQIDLLPLIGLNESDAKSDFFAQALAKELDTEAGQILDYDLSLYNMEEPCVLGIEEELISSPRLDNLTSIYALIKAIINGTSKERISVIAGFDNEEIGSKTKQGADSSLLSFILQKIYYGYQPDALCFSETILQSFLLSVDVAHCLHPNKPEKNDPVVKTYLNQGPVIKIDLNQKYTFDTESIAILEQICQTKNIPYQKFVNRSDIAGGSTLGSLASSLLPMRTVDIGVPLLAMHSARELMGRKDEELLIQMIQAFFLA